MADPVSDRAAVSARGRLVDRARTRPVALLLVTVAVTGAGLVLRLLGYRGPAEACWLVAALIGLASSGWWLVAAARRGRIGVDAVAVLALLGALATGEQLAGAVIAIMLASGRAIEAEASARAQRDLAVLRSRAPQVVHRYGADGLADPPLAEVATGDRLLVRPGEVVPVDGTLLSPIAVLDEAALTGEPLPVEHGPGDALRSGTVNAGDAFDLLAAATAAESTYAGIVALVEQAGSSESPFVRTADRFAGAFVGVSIAIAAAAWAVSGDATRAVAVLVVATPCPLILAAPVAIVSGLAAAARRGVVLKSGDVLERLADGEVLLFDKTGTITEGAPQVVEVITDGTRSEDELLRLAGSLDQISLHVLAGAVVGFARERGIDLVVPVDAEEVPGQGVTGTVDGHRVSVGKASQLVPDPPPAWARTVGRRARLDGALTVAVSVDGAPAGALILLDPIRSDAARTIRNLREGGIRRIVMVTGDRADVAETVGAVIGVDAVIADRSPAQKVEAVAREGASGRTIMVGDGINDAPALAAADVGVAIGARGASATSETADAVLVVDRIERLGEAIEVAHRARRIARQSALAGIGLSVAAMGVAAVGLLPVIAGAILQEVIDVAVILNALRARARPGGVLDVDLRDQVVVDRYTDEHAVLRPGLAVVRRAADAIGVVPDREAIAQASAARAFLEEQILPHELAEDRELYPVFDRMLGGSDPTAPMSRAHTEIAALIRRLGALLAEIDPDALDSDDLLELRRMLYGLHAILELHFAQEDDSYLSRAAL